MKADSRLNFVYVQDVADAILVDEAKCPKCRLWMEVNPKESIGKVQIVCTNCGWMGFVGREGIIE